MITSDSNEDTLEAITPTTDSGESLISLDDIPDENQETSCFSCKQNLRGLYCHQCGQKNDDFRRSIFSLMSETIASIFSLENRIWRTSAALIFKPGKVSREFADGKRTIWTSPVKIYLALSIILFGYMSLTQTRIFSIRTDIVAKSGIEGSVETLDDSLVQLKPDFGFFRRQAEIDMLNKDTDFERVRRLMSGTPQEIYVFDGDLTSLDLTPTDEILRSSGSWPADFDESDPETSLETARKEALETYAERIEDAVEELNWINSIKLGGISLADLISETHSPIEGIETPRQLDQNENTNLQLLIKESILPLDEELNSLGLTREDLFKLPTEISNKSRVNFGDVQIKKVKLSDVDLQDLNARVLRNPAILNDGLSKYLPRIMFLMMPLSAIIGMIFIRGRHTAYLYDHLIHATYIHAVTFAFLLLLILLAQWTSLDKLGVIFFLGMVAYLPLSTKKMFKRGWFKTIFASYSIACLYGFIMFFVVTVLTIISLANAAITAQI